MLIMLDLDRILVHKHICILQIIMLILIIVYGHFRRLHLILVLWFNLYLLIEHIKLKLIVLMLVLI